ncbi:uncharacterized protein LOC111072636 [Drosophila obscura]|uniref:uncharacterized protein LOC111072636 n=1 Tax=Drosophila obscura TaxID=7282 RepID=UPI001BB14860|nr:uncharacterized protein LOC111072636 [Drosophila obscura]
MDRFRKVPKCCTNSLRPCLTHKSKWKRKSNAITDVNPQELSVPMLLDRECLRQVIATYMDKLSKNHPQATMGCGTPSPCFQKVFSMLWYLDSFFDDIKHCFVEAGAQMGPDAEAYAACCKSRKKIAIKEHKEPSIGQKRERRPFHAEAEADEKELIEQQDSGQRDTRNPAKHKWRLDHEQRLNDKAKERELRDQEDKGHRDTRNRDRRPFHAEAEADEKELIEQQDSGQRDTRNPAKHKWRLDHEQRLNDKAKERELRDQEDKGHRDTRNRDRRPFPAKPKWRLEYEQRLKDEAEEEAKEKELRDQEDSGQRDTRKDKAQSELRRRQQLKRASRAAKGIHDSGPYHDPTPEKPPMQEEPEVNQEEKQSHEKTLMKSFPRNKSTASIHTPFGHYMEDTVKEDSHRPTDLFDKMLKSAAAVVPEHHPSLKSTHTLITSKDVAKLKGHRKPDLSQKRHKAYETPQSEDTKMPHQRTSYTKPLREMLQGQAVTERTPLLSSSHRMLLGKKEDSKRKPTTGSQRQKRSRDRSKNEQDSKRKRITGSQRLAGLKKGATGSSKNKQDLNKISEDSARHEEDSQGKGTTGSRGQEGPDSNIRSKDSTKNELGTREGRDSFDSFASVNLETFLKEREKSQAELTRSLNNRGKKVNIIAPKFSKTFGKMLTGKSAAIPELHPALKSFHKIPTAVDQEPPAHKRAHGSKRGKVISGIPAHLLSEKRNVFKGQRRPMEASSNVPSRYVRSSIGSIASILKAPTEFEEEPLEIKAESDNKTLYKTNRQKFKSSGNIARLGKHRLADYQPDEFVPYSSQIEHGTSSDIFRHLLLGEGAPLPKEKIAYKNQQMKKFTFYIKGSRPDRKIMRREGSKHSIGYLSPTRSLLSRASWLSKKSIHSRNSKGSVISIMDMAKAELPDQIDTIKEDTFDEFEFMFRNMPDPFLTDNDQKSDATSPSAILSGPTSRRHSKTVHRTENTKEERAALEAKIKMLMEHCAIREISQPKVKRNFVAEAIDRTYVPPPNKKPDPIKPKPRPRDKYPTTVELLKVPPTPNWPTFAERHRQKYQAEMSTEWEYPLLEPVQPVKIRRYSDRPSDFLCIAKLLEHKKTLEDPHPPAKVAEHGAAGDGQAVDEDHYDCNICNRLGKYKLEPDSPLIKKLKAQSRRFELRAYYRQMRQRELQKGLRVTPVASCPGCPLFTDSLSHLLAEKVSCS